jgi:uncharacterized membrane protein
MELQPLLRSFIASSWFISLPTMGVFYGYIGWQHLVNPRFFLNIMPSFIPYPDTAVLWSGIWEMGVAVFLLPSRTRRFAAWMAFVLLVLVSPVNINMCFDGEICQILGFSKAEAALRLFFQIPLLLLARWHAIGLNHDLYSLVCSVLFFPTILYFIQL